MRYLFLLIFFISCAHQKTLPGEELVSINAALNQAQASYLRGCVEAMKQLNVPVAYPGCYDKSLIHRQELDHTMGTDL